jgi:hypothetical protein
MVKKITIFLCKQMFNIRLNSTTYYEVKNVILRRGKGINGSNNL